MKKFLLLLAVIALGCYSTQAISTTTGIERGYISVSTTANTELAPDVAEVSIAVQTYDTKSMQKATLQNKDISEKVIKELKAMINTENGDFIKTSDYNASPLYSYLGSKSIRQLPTIKHKVNVTTKATITAIVTPMRKVQVKIGNAPVKTRASIHATLHLIPITMKIAFRRMSTTTMKMIRIHALKYGTNVFKSK